LQRRGFDRSGPKWMDMHPLAPNQWEEEGGKEMKEILAGFAKKRLFWIIASCGVIFLGWAVYLTVFNLLYTDPYKRHWDSLPTLPNGETAALILDTHPSGPYYIDVLTDQGGYYGYDGLGENGKWAPIPPIALYPGPNPVDQKIQMPTLPPGTRGFYLWYEHYQGSIDFLVYIIRADGQLASWYDSQGDGRWDSDEIGLVACLCGIYVLVPGIIVGLVVDFGINKRWKKKQQSGE
jgi:hypothetical protein